MNYEELWKLLLDSVEDQDAQFTIKHARAFGLAVQEASEACYARNYEGANEGDAVATALFTLRARIKVLTA